MFLAFSGFLVFGDTGQYEEIDFFLFSANSSDRFANEFQAMIQLENLARYLIARNPGPGQIRVQGYASSAKNDIDPGELSKKRALFVMLELQNLGVPPDLFSEPQAYGEVDFWGTNITEAEKNPNRRVRVLLPDTFLAAAALIADEGAIVQEAAQSESNAPFPWMLLLLLLLLAGIALAGIILFLVKKSARTTANEPIIKEAQEEIETFLQDLCAVEFPIEPEEPEDPEYSEDSEENRGPLSDATLMVLLGISGGALPGALAEVPPAATGDSADPHIRKSRFSELQNIIREIIYNMPADTYFDVHTVVEILLQQHDDVYLTNVGNYTSAAHYHSKISFLIGHDTDIVEKAGNSYSKNIHDKFSECHLFMRKK